MVTRNKIAYLQEALPRLLARLGEPDELVLVDGASNDGTLDFLRSPGIAKRITTLISESDVNESHAWNKGLLAARGELIKLISDDDVYCYDCLDLCRDYMLSHPEVHALAGNMADVSLDRPEGIKPRLFQGEAFEDWNRGGPPFWFSGLPLMLRRDALPLCGLMHTGIECPDTDFSLRVTSLPEFRLAWCHGIMCVRIDNPLSKYRLRNIAVTLDSRRVMSFYRPAPRISWGERARLRLMSWWAAHRSSSGAKPAHEAQTGVDPKTMFRQCQEFLSASHALGPPVVSCGCRSRNTVPPRG